MNRKYELTEETIHYAGRTLYRIKALQDFGNIKAGELGGWIEKESNLSHDGNCWASGDAKVFGDAMVCGNAVVCGDAEVYGNAEVYGDAEVYGNAEVESMKDYIVFKNWWSSGRYFTWTRSDNMWTVGCFHGTGEELVEKACKDSEESGRHYKEIVNYVEKCVLGKEEGNEQGDLHIPRSGGQAGRITIKGIDMEELKITETKKSMRIEDARYRIEAERDDKETVVEVYGKPDGDIVCSASFDRGFPFGLMAEAIRRLEEAGL